jgi:hypothetical protein
LANPNGVVITSLSAGGYQSTTFLQNHGQSGQVIAALGFDAILIGYGANEAASGVTPEDFRSQQLAFMSQLRAWTRPDMPIILMADPYRSGLSPAQADNFDRYAGAQYQIAGSDGRTLAVNGRRALEDIGWSAAGSPALYLADGVHYTALGGRTKAATEMLLLDSYVVSPCYANCDHSTSAPVLNVNDYTCFLNRFAAGDSRANCDGSTIAPVLNVNDFTCFANRYAVGCP